MFRTSPKTRLGELLVSRRLISQSQLEQALGLQKRNGQKLGLVLIQQGWLTQQQLRQALTQQRFQHLTASLLLTCGTFFAPLVKIASAQTVAPVMSVNTKAQGEQRSGEGVSQSVAVAPSWYYRPKLQRPVDVDQMPLAANPTESAPLIGFCHPLQGYGLLSQGFRGLSHQGRMEYAMDLQVSLGTPVYAVRSGRVVGLEDRFADNGGGPDKIYEFNYALIEHQGNYRSAYLHLRQGFQRRAGIKVGDYVTAGQLIGYSGNSGWSTGPHLHVEVQRRSKPGTFGETVPFKLGRACESPNIVVASEKTTPQLSPAMTDAASGIGAGDQSQVKPFPQAQQHLQSLPRACSAQGCGCPTCSTAANQITANPITSNQTPGNVVPQFQEATSRLSEPVSSLLSGRLERLLLR